VTVARHRLVELDGSAAGARIAPDADDRDHILYFRPP
jgi:hypothetical protein